MVNVRNALMVEIEIKNVAVVEKSNMGDSILSSFAFHEEREKAFLDQRNS